MNKTITYYQNNGTEFIDSTFKLDMTKNYHFFEKYLPSKGTILDLGFGSGRDSIHFQKNYEVYAYDPTPLFVEQGSKLGLKHVFCKKAEEIDDKDKFDGIWACASLLHIEKINLPLVFLNCYNALKQNGVMYVSFKYGNFEGDLKGRYFTYLNEVELRKIIKNTPFNIEEIAITFDVRQTKSNEKWLNVILRK